VIRERIAGQQIARDVVEPDALTQVVKQLRGFHDFSSTKMTRNPLAEAEGISRAGGCVVGYCP